MPFIHYKGYDDSKPPFDPSLMVSFRKRRFKLRTRHYPERFLADKIYRNRDNLKYCAERGIRLSGPALGRPKKDEIRDRKQEYIDQGERVEVERKFSLAKRKCGLGLIVTKLENTVGHSIAMSVLLLNLKKVPCHFFEFLHFCFFKVNSSNLGLFSRHYLEY